MPASGEEVDAWYFRIVADPRKAALAILLGKWTAMTTGWIAERLAMGHASTVSRLAKAEESHAAALRKLERAIRAAGGA